MLQAAATQETIQRQLAMEREYLGSVAPPGPPLLH